MAPQLQTSHPLLAGDIPTDARSIANTVAPPHGG